MKKLFIISMIIFSTIFVTGCGQSSPSSTNNQNNQDKQNSTIGDTKQNDNVSSQDESNNQSHNNKTTSNSQNDNTNKKVDNSTNNKTNKKDYYTKKLDDIIVKIDKEYNDKDQYTTQDMRRANSEKYKLWDDALNEIYKDLQSTLSHSDKEKLKQEELAWISKKEADAKSASKEVEGGTLEPVVYSASLIDSTKKRCYELVDKYMN